LEVRRRSIPDNYSYSIITHCGGIKMLQKVNLKTVANKISEIGLLFLVIIL